MIWPDSMRRNPSDRPGGAAARARGRERPRRSASASSPRPPSCPRARPRGSSPRSSARASSSATATAAACARGRSLLRFAHRGAEPDVTLVELADEPLDALAEASRRDRQPRRPDPARRRPARAGRQPALPRLDELGRAARALPLHRDRQGLPRLGAAGCLGELTRDARDDHRSRRLEPSSAVRRGLRDRRRRARGRPDRARRARLRRRRRAIAALSHLRPHDPPRRRAASTELAPRSSSEARRALAASSATKTTKRGAHDPRRDPPGALRPHAGRRRARR